MRLVYSCKFKVTADESSVQETIKIIDRMCVGKQVRKGPDWKFKDQDGHGEGTVIDADVPSLKDWVKVKWDIGHTNHYRWGAENAFDLVIV